MCMIDDYTSYVTIVSPDGLYFQSYDLNTGGTIASAPVGSTIYMNAHVYNVVTYEESYNVVFYDSNLGNWTLISEYIYADAGTDGYVTIPSYTQTSAGMTGMFACVDIDNNILCESASFRISVPASVAPVAPSCSELDVFTVINGSLSGQEPTIGQTVSADYIGCTGSPNSFTWDWGDGTVIPSVGSGAQTHVYNTAGTYTIKVTATNTTTGLSGSDSWILVVHPTGYTEGVNPGGDINVPSSGTVGTAVTATLTNITGTPTTYAWNWGDGTASVTVETSAAQTHVYSAAGYYVVSVYFTDASGLESTDQVDLRINASSSTTACGTG